MSKQGLLLLNLGSPDSPQTADVAKYLRQFLTDRFVIDLPAPLRYALVYGLIVPFRAPKSAEAYASIWTPNGSPLVQHTREFAQAVAQRLVPRGVDVRWAMRYGSPAVADVVRDWDVDDIKIVPLYPQYADSSTRTALVATYQALARQRHKATTRFLLDFYGEDEFISAMARQITQVAQDFGPEVLLVSFHGLPQHHLSKIHPSHCQVAPHCCDTVTERNRLCYRAQCLFTANAIRHQLGWSPAKVKVKVSFQSRLGRRPWIKPFTDEVIEELAGQGVKRVLVTCPSFVADCLETLEEIEIRLRAQFLAAGGQELKLVPALNAQTHWVNDFVKMIEKPELTWQKVVDHQLNI